MATVSMIVMAVAGVIVTTALRTRGIYTGGMAAHEHIAAALTTLPPFDAVVLALGSHKSRKLQIPGEDKTGVYHGVTFLREIALGHAPDVAGKRIGIVGGGDVAIDVARSAWRLGAAEVHVIYRRTEEDMPAHKEEIHAAHAEGVQFHFLVNPVSVLGDGQVTGVCLRPQRLAEFDEGGRRRPKAIEGADFDLALDMLVPAIGQTTDFDWMPADDSSVQTTWNSVLKTDDAFQTTRPGVFACGNVLHVHDIADLVTLESQKAGRAAARDVLEGKAPDSPVVSVKNGEGLVYALPQKIRTKIADDITTVYFRVNRIFRNATVYVSGCNGGMAAFKRQHMAPGEMQRIKLPREIFEKSGGEIIISAKATDPDGVASVTVSYQIVTPGNYLPRYLSNVPAGSNIATEVRALNPAFELASNWTTVPMQDDGTLRDLQGGDSVWTVALSLIHISEPTRPH